MERFALLRKLVISCTCLAITGAIFPQSVSPDSLYPEYISRDKGHGEFTNDFVLVSWKEKMPEGLTVVRRLDEHTGIAVNDSSFRHSAGKLLYALPANNEWKLSSGARMALQQNKAGEQQFLLSAVDRNRFISLLLKTTGKFKVIRTDNSSYSLLISASVKTLKEELLPIKEIIFIDKCAKPHTETAIIGYNRSINGVNAVDYAIPGANGRNIVAGIKEQKMQEADLDLYKRVLTSPIAAANITSHATVISSIIGGAGNSFYDGRGIANGCLFFPSSFENLFPDDAAVLNTNKVSIQNHSYGTIIQSFYGAEAVSYDAQTWQNKNLLHVFSAGNQGTAAATSGPYAGLTGYANLTGNFKMAKNVITVGAMDDKGLLPAESSLGPLYDGRIAPQLIALGPNGTSDAAAVVSGTIAVMQQVYTDSNSQQLPPAALVKSVLYNTAEDIYRSGIDYKTGYGLLNSYDAVKALQQKNYDGAALSQGQQWTKTITVPAGIAQLKVTLAWTDTAAQVNTSKAIINDLDLEVQDLNNGFTFRPWVLSSAASTDSLVKLPVRKRDSLNTAEQVSIQLPAAGNYQVKVTGTSMSNNNVPFYVAIKQDTLHTFRFTSPQHTADVNRNENPLLDIRWKAFVADTNETGNLYISYNSGAGWQLIKTGQKIYTNYFQWNIKDTVSRAMFRMETGFGNFYSSEFVISNVIRPNIDFLCTDSFGLSWNRHIYAGSYKIYSLTDSPYLKHVLTTTDTFIVLKRNIYPQLVYAVEPVLSNNIPAARSIAFDITQQGVNCFYRTLFYNLLDGNQLDLVLELSAAALVDSIRFEMTNPAGAFLRNAGSLKVIPSTGIYHQLVPDIPQGTSYWRARIKLKSGIVVYTEIIAVLTSGKKAILFYPNPSRRNQSMSWVIQQGIPASSRLQLYDISGRLLRDYSELPLLVDLSGLSAGVYIYKLFAEPGKLTETGRLLVTN